MCSAEPVDSICDDGDDCTQDTCGPLGCEYVNICEPPVDAICRSPGYWSTHSGFEPNKAGREAANVGQLLIDAVGPLEVCGQMLTSTTNLSSPYLEGLGLSSILEGLCVSVGGVRERQLYRQLVAAALNCAASGEANNCDALVPIFDACSDLCAGDPSFIDPPTVGECIEQLDCFNNGGQSDGEGCVFGTCEVNPEISCGLEPGDCPDVNGSPQNCIPFADSCRTAELCNEDIGWCPIEGPASSPGACREARLNSCTIDSCE
ncbi:MAG: hypothetical protein LC667_04430 [Thioalkalivibrio sp.]|nr:hypothetical protein [Thioalkalivibrio sp.]